MSRIKIVDHKDPQTRYRGKTRRIVLEDAAPEGLGMPLTPEEAETVKTWLESVEDYLPGAGGPRDR